MNRDLKNEYINSMNASAPDMDKLWEKIAASECTDSDITPFESAAEDTAKLPSGRRVNFYRSFAAVAAVFTAVICLSLVFDNSVSDMSETNYSQGIAAGDSSSEEKCDDMAEAIMQPVRGWEYSSSYASVSSYSSLNLAETDSGIYTALSSNTDETEYFVEADVLRQTDYFIDGRIISSEIMDDCVVYDIEAVHIVSDDEFTLPMNIRAVSRSRYTLRDNREYLLPIREENGELIIVFDNAPQIEIAEDRTIVYHNGWKSLNGSGEYISYPQVYEDDYFYDRMNITAESSLERLFESWEEIRGD